MKIRMGFVSNSSSSSFVIAADANGDTKIHVYVITDLNDIAKRIETLEDFHRYIVEERGWGDVGEYRQYNDEEYQKIVATFKKGKILFVGEADTGASDTIEQIIASEGLKSVQLIGNQELIHDDGGHQ
jgi:hypothetical protein